jgi:hypothetical protein
MKVLGIDPGMTTGWAVAAISEARDTFKWLTISTPEGIPYSGFNDWLWKTVPKVDLVIAEDYVLDPRVKKWDGARNMKNSLLTKGLVGRIELTCWHFHVNLVLQEAKVKPNGFRMNKIKYPNNPRDPMRHYYDAKAHIRHYLRMEFDI